MLITNDIAKDIYVAEVFDILLKLLLVKLILHNTINEEDVHDYD